MFPRVYCGSSSALTHRTHGVYAHFFVTNAKISLYSLPGTIHIGTDSYYTSTLSGSARLCQTYTNAVGESVLVPESLLKPVKKWLCAGRRQILCPDTHSSSTIFTVEDRTKEVFIIQVVIIPVTVIASSLHCVCVFVYFFLWLK